MSEVYLVCVPETETELFRFMKGRADSPLSRRGMAQCRALKSYFTDTRINRIWSGEQRCAFNTAHAIASACGGTVERTAALDEIDLGPWEKSPVGNIAFDQPVKYQKFLADPSHWDMGGAETGCEAAERITVFFKGVVETNADDTIVLVSHKYVIRLLLESLAGSDETISDLPENGSVTRIATDGTGSYIIETYDTAHISDQMKTEHITIPHDVPFDSTLYYQWLRATEYGELFADAVESIWEESGQTAPLNRFDVMDEASRYETVIGYAEQIPAGFLQYDLIDGKIRLLFSHPGARCAGIGTQLVGKAIIDAEERGWETLSITLPENNPYKLFFEKLGFEKKETDIDGNEVYVREIEHR